MHRSVQGVSSHCLVLPPAGACQATSVATAFSALGFCSSALSFCSCSSFSCCNRLRAHHSNLHNKAELALGLVGCPPHVTEAQLLLQLYASAGLDMLRRLNGQYAFCLYDSKQVRTGWGTSHDILPARR